MTASSQDAADRELRVRRRQTGAPGVIVLELDDPDGAELPPWEPGAHLDLALPGGLDRQYSLCGDPADRTSYTIAVLREPQSRGGSAWVHQKLTTGGRVRLREVRNLFPLAPAEHYVFVAGGIGITPILPMLAAATAAGSSWELHYGGRSRRSMAFLDDLVAEGDSVVRIYPQDEVGILPVADLVGTPREGALVYACGPGPLLDAVQEQASRWPEGSVHIERFAPAEVGAPVWDGAFEVELAYSGLTVTVEPGESVLETIEAAGISCLSSCQDGTCGTCETPVLEGEVDHRDSILTEAERALHDKMFICVSRAACPKLVVGL
ncbi:PDR/VanB family oxidoreductase [Nocardioides acrostichi]|uniref:PDR/VanB family oxidoreductase n=1 Tax=Nocardioides acrostichi TaxID=2784339 RepID=UPI002E2E3ED8|nr:2Fe-2S iron-sulfur cluster-binding protein [Nocardioides acrostichi]